MPPLFLLCAWRYSVLPIPSACRLPCGASSSGVVMAALLDELLQLLHAPLLGLDALVQRLGSAIDSGKCSVQIVKGSDALCLQADDGAADFLQLRCAVLLLPAARILAASLPFHAQIFRQQRGNVRRAWGGLQLLLFSENLRKPFPQFVDIAPDFPDDTVGLSNAL